MTDSGVEVRDTPAVAETAPPQPKPKTIVIAQATSAPNTLKAKR